MGHALNGVHRAVKMLGGEVLVECPLNVLPLQERLGDLPASRQHDFFFVMKQNFVRAGTEMSRMTVPMTAPAVRVKIAELERELSTLKQMLSCMEE